MIKLIKVLLFSKELLNFYRLGFFFLFLNFKKSLMVLWLGVIVVLILVVLVLEIRDLGMRKKLIFDFILSVLDL